MADDSLMIDGILQSVERHGIEPHHDQETLEHLMPSLPLEGPITEYRQSASFNWRDLKLVVEGEEVIRFKNRIYRTLESDPVFAHQPDEELTRAENREITFKRFKRLMEYNLLSDDDFIGNPLLTQTLYTALGQYDWSLSAKRFLAYEFVTVSLRGGGSSRHLAVLDQLVNFDALGCFALTELAHGSNTKAMGTRADFDATTNEFILNTPNFESTKCWSGNLGQSATHAVCFAQLYVNGVNHGLSGLIVPIRDPKTLLPYPGVTVGDMGGKIGLNGLDNGFLLFKDYKIPKGYLMNRTGDVNASGEYVTQIKDRKRRVGITLGTLSMGRVGIITIAVANMQKALAIGLRYSVARRQFGPPSEDDSTPIKEWPVIEYQMQQWRLFPYLAATYVLDIFCQSFLRDFLNFQVAVLFGTSSGSLAELGQEIHAIACAAKPIAGWLCRDTIQECREACGGHGYLKASGLGDLRNDHDANNTYEGDNNVIQMQTSNFLIRKYKDAIVARNNPVPATEEDLGNDGRVHSQLHSVDILNDAEAYVRERFNVHCEEDLLKMDTILHAYRFLVSYLLFRSMDKYEAELKKANGNVFAARENSQVYFSRSLSFAYIEHTILMRYDRFLREEIADDVPAPVRTVLTKLGLLYGLWSLDAHSATLFEGGYFTGPKPTQLIRSAILKLCTEIKPDAMALVDAMSPPDFILNSVLGMADGKIYENIFKMLTSRKEHFERPSWWREFTENKPVIGSHDPVEKVPSKM